jgi:hypothetical protein
LLASFPSTQSGQGDDALDGYLIGTREIPVDFLAIAAQRFLSGSVPGQHMTFPPTAAQFATEARDHWYKALEAEREKQARLAPPKPKEPEISPEERARVKAKFDALVASMAHEKMTDQAASAKLRDRGDLIETPGYSYPVSRTLAKQLGIGDPEGDADVS